MLDWFLVLLVGLSIWLWRLNERYYVLALFAPRARAVDGGTLDHIAPTAKGRTIFGNMFDLKEKDNDALFKHVRIVSKELQKSYLEYGFGMTFYNVVDAEAAEIVLTNPNLIDKGLVYHFMQRFLKQGLLTSGGNKWHARRKLMTPTFHFQILGEFIDTFRTEAFKFIAENCTELENVVSLTNSIPKMTLNIICDTAMGVQLDDLATEGERYRDSFSKVEHSFAVRTRNPLLWHDKMFDIFGPRDMREAVRIVHAFSNNIISKRRELFEQEENITPRKNKRLAMLDTLLSAEKAQLIDHEGICEEVDTLMFEGFDTTSTALTFALWNLAHNMAAQNRCYEELQENLDVDISEWDISRLSRLKYLECVIKETIRLYPSAPLITRVVDVETALPNGLVIPAKSNVNIHIFDIHRNAKYYTDPDVFEPRRFEAEQMAKRPTFAYLPFSAGQRNCIGQKFAMLEMKMLLSVILCNYEILPVEAGDALDLTFGLILRPKSEVKLRFIRRP